MLESIQDELKSVKENQETFSREVNLRFDSVDNRLNVVDNRLNGMDDRFDVMDNRFNAMDDRFDVMDNRFNAMDDRFNAVDARFNVMDGKLDGIKNQLDRIEAESNDDVVALLESISGKIETLATKEDIEYLAGRLGRTELEIDRLKRAK